MIIFGGLTAVVIAQIHYFRAIYISVIPSRIRIEVFNLNLWYKIYHDDLLYTHCSGVVGFEVGGYIGKKEKGMRKKIKHLKINKITSGIGFFVNILYSNQIINIY